MSGDSYSNLSQLAAFSEMGGDKGSNALDQTDNARDMYRGVLSGIIGGFTSVKVCSIDMSNERDRVKYEELLNNPEVTILKEDSTFAVFESKDRDGYAKETRYMVYLKYRVSDVDKVFDKMNAYLDSLDALTPPISDPGGLAELITAWGFFYTDVPASKHVKFYAVVLRIEKMIIDVNERAKAAGKANAVKAEDLVKSMKNRFVMTDVIVPDPVIPAPEPDSATVEAGLRKLDEEVNDLTEGDDSELPVDAGDALKADGLNILNKLVKVDRLKTAAQLKADTGKAAVPGETEAGVNTDPVPEKSGKTKGKTVK
ncbi:MAG: hypothetical protein WC261_02885 [Synergistaceae bacterium]|jgi:hypothetical protein